MSPETDKEKALPRCIKLTLEYDGAGFNGWQVQSGLAPGEKSAECVRTAQGTVEEALKELAGRAIRIAGASRTDAGVHALGQVASFILPDEVALDCREICHGLNGHMAKDIAAVRAEEMPLSFHAQRDAAGKVYSYSLFSRYERPALLRLTHWHVRFPLNLEAMRQGAALLPGRHDFTSFASRLAETQMQRAADGQKAIETVREIRRVEINADPAFPGRFVIRVEGSGFLYQMMRTIAGSLVDVGRGYRKPEWIAEVLAARDRRLAGPTAPAHGLCLEKVMYDSEDAGILPANGRRNAGHPNGGQDARVPGN
jgi:tRNA pseudouridine38-40 synthase